LSQVSLPLVGRVANAVSRVGVLSTRWPRTTPPGGVQPGHTPNGPSSPGLTRGPRRTRGVATDWLAVSAPRLVSSPPPTTLRVVPPPHKGEGDLTALSLLPTADCLP